MSNHLESLHHIMERTFLSSLRLFCMNVFYLLKVYGSWYGGWECIIWVPFCEINFKEDYNFKNFLWLSLCIPNGVISYSSMVTCTTKYKQLGLITLHTLYHFKRCKEFGSYTCTDIFFQSASSVFIINTNDVHFFHTLSYYKIALTCFQIS